MTSIKQFEASRRNSLKSTRPKIEVGKRASRCNAVRRGLTAETVIGALEDAEDYKAFHKRRLRCAIGCGAGASAPISQLLWRRRQAITIEMGPFEIQVALSQQL